MQLSGQQSYEAALKISPHLPHFNRYRHRQQRCPKRLLEESESIKLGFTAQRFNSAPHVLNGVQLSSYQAYEAAGAATNAAFNTAVCLLGPALSLQKDSF